MKFPPGRWGADRPIRIKKDMMTDFLAQMTALLAKARASDSFNQIK